MTRRSASGESAQLNSFADGQETTSKENTIDGQAFQTSYGR
ncbi:MAG: hypothetical protein WBM69_06675 [Desulfobacterales bacterium]